MGRELGMHCLPEFLALFLPQRLRLGPRNDDLTEALQFHILARIKKFVIAPGERNQMSVALHNASGCFRDHS